MSKISIILGSTREGRQGEKVARWVQKVASSRTNFQSELLDLRDWPLPFYNKPYSPASVKGDYGDDLTNRWATKIRESDGFIIVTPEYNHGYPAVLKNSLDWVYAEWNKKPVAFVGYSGGAGSGIRAVEQLRLVSIELQMVPLRQDVLISTVQKQISDAGEPVDEALTKRLNGVIDQLLWMTEALKKARG